MTNVNEGMTKSIADDFDRLRDKMRGHIIQPAIILGIDPGETTGMSRMLVGAASDVRLWQWRTKQAKEKGALAEEICVTLDTIRPQLIVMENYKVYSSHAKTHVNQELFTAKLIGRIEQEADKRKIPVVLKMAAESKSFVTNDKLERWGFISNATHEQRHSYDSLRLICHYLLFG